MDIKEQIGCLLTELKKQKPIVHHITNYVTVNDCANITLAIGASPIMADDTAEMADMTAIADVLLLNIGTLNERAVQSMLAAGRYANRKGIPVVLDPVGVGASALRRQTVEQICRQIKLDVVRGNASEIAFMAGQEAVCRGVDAARSSSATGQHAQKLAKNLGCTVAMTGAADIITDGNRTVVIENGQELMELVTGTGCMCTSLVASFCAVTEDYLSAAVAGVLCMSLAGDLAYIKAGQAGTASYREAIIDIVSQLNKETILAKAKIHT
jgi:hydroxyethylthiazole kinase